MEQLRKEIIELLKEIQEPFINTKENNDYLVVLQQVKELLFKEEGLILKIEYYLLKASHSPINIVNQWTDKFLKDDPDFKTIQIAPHPIKAHILLKYCFKENISTMLGMMKNLQSHFFPEMLPPEKLESRIIELKNHLYQETIDILSRTFHTICYFKSTQLLRNIEVYRFMPFVSQNVENKLKKYYQCFDSEGVFEQLILYINQEANIYPINERLIKAIRYPILGLLIQHENILQTIEKHLIITQMLFYNFLYDDNLASDLSEIATMLMHIDRLENYYKKNQKDQEILNSSSELVQLILSSALPFNIKKILLHENYHPHLHTIHHNYLTEFLVYLYFKQEFDVNDVSNFNVFREKIQDNNYLNFVLTDEVRNVLIKHLINAFEAESTFNWFGKPTGTRLLSQITKDNFFKNFQHEEAQKIGLCSFSFLM